MLNNSIAKSVQLNSRLEAFPLFSQVWLSNPILLDRSTENEWNTFNCKRSIMAIHAETVLSHDDVFAAVIGCDVVQGQCGHAVGLPHFDALVLHQLFALIQET